ncbi:MAG: MXAN_5187 C-terminal domain-containing protein [Pseudomonadota bacterium]
MPVPTPPPDSETIVKDVDLLTRELEKLKVSYDQYFLGFDKFEPIKARSTVSNLFRKISGAQVQNARLRFRIEQLVARHNSFSQYWNRILKEIEDGKYRRDIFRANLHDKERSQPKAKVVSEIPKLQDPYEVLYNQYVNARKKCNESLAGLTLEAFRKSMSAQLQVLKQKTPQSSFKFQVAVEGGKTKIKAIPQTTAKPK